MIRRPPRSTLFPYTDALPICDGTNTQTVCYNFGLYVGKRYKSRKNIDRKSTRLNSSHSQISYAVFCLKKKKDLRSLHFLCITSHATTSIYHRIRPATTERACV